MSLDLTPISGRTAQPWFFVVSWHQGMYNAAAHRAHWAVRQPADSTERRMRLEEANDLARRLLLVSTSALIDMQKSSAKRKGYQRPKPDQEALHTFLDQIVEGSAAVVLGGIRLELGIAYRPPKEPIHYPHDRSKLLENLVEEEHSARDMLEPGWLAAYGDASSRAGRVDYNLACFYATAAWKEYENGPDESHAILEALERAEQKLRTALAHLDTDDRAVLSGWIDKDPSLHGLRVLATDAYEAIVGPLRRSQPPKPPEPKKDRGWWRSLFAFD